MKLIYQTNKNSQFDLLSLLSESGEKIISLMNHAEADDTKGIRFHVHGKLECPTDSDIDGITMTGEWLLRINNTSNGPSVVGFTPKDINRIYILSGGLIEIVLK